MRSLSRTIVCPSWTVRAVLRTCGALLLAGALACDEPAKPDLVAIPDNKLLQGGTMPLPVSSRHGTTVTVQDPGVSGLTISPLTYQNITGNETATITAAPNAPLGIHRINVTGVNGFNGSQTQTITVWADVVNPFTVRSYSHPSGRAGQIMAGEAEISRHFKFTDVVTFAIQGLPPNSVVTFAPPDRDVSTFTIVAPVGAAPGSYNASIVATSGAIVRTTGVTVDIQPPLVTPDFSMAIAPATIELLPSATASATIRIVRNAGVTGNIALTTSTLPAGVNGAITPVSADESVLTLTSTGAPLSSASTITVTGVANGVTRTATFSLAVVPVPDFTLTPATGPLILQNPLTTAQSVAIAITRTGRVGPVAFAVSGVPQGVQAAFAASPVAGNVALLIVSPTGTTPVGDHTVTITATADGLTRTAVVILRVLASAGDFSVDFGLTSIDVARGASTLLAINLPRTGTLVGSAISLATSAVPPQSSAVIAPATTTAATSFVTLSIDSTAPLGPHPLTVTATGGGLTRTGTITINTLPLAAPGFRLTPIPTQFQFPRSAFTPFAINITRIGGFVGTVTMSAVSPLPGNIIIEFTPFPSTPDLIRVNMYASQNVPPGTYVIPFTGTSGVLTVTVNITIVVDP